MGTVAVIGEASRVEAFGLAGVRVFTAATAEDTAAAWERLPDDVDVVILTPLAAAAIGLGRASRRPYAVVLPA